MTPKTLKTKESYIKRLKEVDLIPELLTYKDYPKVSKALGWQQSTFRTVLNFLGQDTGDLMEGYREYLPTPEDIETLSAEVGTSLIRTLSLTGCRLGELWRMQIKGSTLLIFTSKGSANVRINIDAFTLESRTLIKYWVNFKSLKVSYDAVRKRWQRSSVTEGCTPHAFRHRFVTKMVEDGDLSLEDVCMMTGHRSTRSVRRYLHRQFAGLCEEILL